MKPYATARAKGLERARPEPHGTTLFVTPTVQSTGSSHPCQHEVKRKPLVCQSAERDLASQAAAIAPGEAPAAASTSVWTIPTILTVLRLFLIPPVVWLFGFSDPAAAALASGIFVVAALTDWLDGYLARKLGQSSAFGAFLDPVADKIMVGAVLVQLCTKTFPAGLFAAHRWLMPALAVAILSRELAMSALREWAVGCGPEARSAVAVNNMGKYKTACQMTSLVMILFTMNGGAGPLYEVFTAAGPWLLIVAACLTVYSFAVYFATIWKFLSQS